MLGSAIVSKTELLSFIWTGTLLLSVGSLFILGILILRRFLAMRQHKHLARLHAELSRYFYITLNAPIEITSATLPKLTPASANIACQIALDILRTTQGQDTDRIVKLLNTWQLFPYLCQILRSGTRGKRIQCLTLFKYFNDAASLKELLNYANDEDHYVQLAALRGLSYRSAIQYIDTIVENISASKRTNMLMLADILARFGESALPALHRLVVSDALMEVRLATIIALGDIGALETTPILNGLLSDPSQEIRAQAIANLGKSGNMRAGELLRPYLNDSSGNVRIQTANALGLLHLKAAIPQLVKALDDEEWWVRYRAAEALFRFGENGIALLKTLRALNTPAGIIANQVLAELQPYHA